MSDKAYGFLKELLEDDQVQMIGRRIENKGDEFFREDELLVETYELFHKKKKKVQ